MSDVLKMKKGDSFGMEKLKTQTKNDVLPGPILIGPVRPSFVAASSPPMKGWSIRRQQNKKIIKDKKSVKELETEIEELTNKWKRALADYQNLEKNIQAWKNNWLEFAASELILKLLPVFENLEKAVQHLKDKGLEATFSQFRKVLEEEGLKVLDVKPGSDFDANLMECVDVAPGEEGKVLKVLEKGYKMKDRPLRVARVVVGKAKIDKREESQAKEQLQKGNYM